ncbi:MAG: GspH/FimT family pseudopilin [Pseudomonadota bacterium]|nr:GspH/FimT family pseudopilin [Pseudomonadota bacterium]
MDRDLREARATGRTLRGITLVELVVVMALVAILTTLAVPALREIVARNQLASLEQELFASLTLARSEAIKRNQNVVLCPSANGTSCAGNARWWHQGWILFVDSNGNDTYDAGTDPPLLRAYAGSDVATIQKNRITSNVRFLANGTARGDNGHFVFCARGNATHPLYIVLANSGRPYTTDTTPQGIDNPLTCGS